jgi:C1A family cysteine protease
MKVLILIFVAGFLSCECGLLDILQKATSFALSIGQNISNFDFSHFENFRKKYKKKYESSEKEGMGLANLALHEQLVDKHNKKFASGRSKFKLGVWEYSDMSSDEIRKSMTGLVRRPSAKSVYQTDFPTDVPSYLNYVEYGWVTNVVSQGICGCCWAISALGSWEGQIAKMTGKAIKLSEQNLIDCNRDEKRGNWGCDGGDMETVYDYIINKAHGINTASYYRYKGQEDKKCRYNPDKSVGSIHEYAKVEPGNETLLMLALAHIGPLSIAVDASSESFQNYKGGVYDDPECGKDINHAVLLVGYGDDPEAGPYWLVKNSWGTSYGEGGYVKIAKDQGNLCGIANEISYPII